MTLRTHYSAARYAGGRVPPLAFLLLRLLPTMTSEQILLVRSSWPAIAERHDEVTRRFYDLLFEIDGSAARLFTGVDMAAQRVKLAEVLAVVVNGLNDIDRLLPAVVALGKRHAHYGVQDRHFDSVGAALLQAFGDTLGDEFTPELRAAWATAYTVLASVMRKSATREVA